MTTIELKDETHASLRGLLEGAEFGALKDASERYLALLAWCATNHGGDFRDFIAHQESAHRYLVLSRDEVQQVRAHNQSRQIDGTQFWAVMRIDAPARRRFVRRLLEFIGCRDEMVNAACGTLGAGSRSDGGHLLGVA